LRSTHAAPSPLLPGQVGGRTGDDEDAPGDLPGQLKEPVDPAARTVTIETRGCMTVTIAPGTRPPSAKPPVAVSVCSNSPIRLTTARSPPAAASGTCHEGRGIARAPILLAGDRVPVRIEPRVVSHDNQAPLDPYTSVVSIGSIAAGAHRSSADPVNRRTTPADHPRRAVVSSENRNPRRTSHP